MDFSNMYNYSIYWVGKQNFHALVLLKNPQNSPFVCPWHTPVKFNIFYHGILSLLEILIHCKPLLKNKQ